MVNLTPRGVDTRVVVTNHDGVVDCHIDETGVEVAIVETLTESRTLAAEVCRDFHICWRPDADPSVVLRKVTCEAVASQNGI
jgi:hypothetical protein